MRALATAVCAVVLWGCSSFDAPLAEIDPKNGSTAVPVDVKPFFILSEQARFDIDANAPEGRLVDVTGLTPKQIGGRLTVDARRIVFEPDFNLTANHRYEFILEQGAIELGPGTRELDGSESPVEPFVWPLRIRFSTQSAPTVRAVYLVNNELAVHFSQAMDEVVTGQVFELLDEESRPVSIGQPVWAGPGRALIPIADPLDPAKVYQLTVGRQAIAADGSRFDGDADGLTGEDDDDFVVQFAGSQQVVVSRLGPSAGGQ